MNVAAIGVGGAGGRIVDRLARELGLGNRSPLSSVHAIDTDTDSLAALGQIPAEARHAIGQFETGGKGTDGDRELAAEIVDDERMEIRRAVEDGISTTVDAIVVAAGLAGGTGSAVTPALVAGLATVYQQPVYAVSVLPAGDTDEASQQNTAQALVGLDESATAQIVFDNDTWLYRDRSLESHGDRINAELTSRFGQLLTVGQEAGDAVGQQVVDTQDVMGTLAGGGLVTLGYASRPIAAWRGANSSLLDGLKRRVLGEDTDEYERGRAVQRTLSWATRGTLTFDCPRGAATHGLVVFRGPAEWLRGDAVSKGREWLANRAGIERLRSGDAPSSGTDSLDVLVVLAGIEQTPRIASLTDEAAVSNEETEAEGDTGDDDADEDPDSWGVPPGESGEDGESGSAEGEPAEPDSAEMETANGESEADEDKSDSDKHTNGGPSAGESMGDSASDGSGDDESDTTTDETDTK